jgi:hypothetical protein
LKTKSIFLFFTYFSISVFFNLGCNSKKIAENSLSGSYKNPPTAEFVFNPEDPRIKNRNFEQVPTIAASADGMQVYVAWYSGGKAPGPGNYLTLSLSLDGGKKWLNDQLVVYPKRQSYRFFDPMLWRDNNGEIRLFYGSAKDSLIWDGFGGVNSIRLAWNGIQTTASKPIYHANGVMSNKPIYMSSKNQTLYPIYLDKPLDGSISSIQYPKNGVFIYSGNSNSNQFKPYSSINIEEELRIHDEPQLVEISNSGDLLAMLRTTKGIYFTNSKDFGKSWEPLEPFTAIGPTTSSRFYLGKLSSGNLLLIANNSATRNKMTAFLSKDGGKTWPHKLLLDARENVSYPDADQTIDGNIHVVFDRERTGDKDILYCKFTENDLILNNLDAIFKTRVNIKSK